MVHLRYVSTFLLRHQIPKHFQLFLSVLQIELNIFFTSGYTFNSIRSDTDYRYIFRNLKIIFIRQMRQKCFIIGNENCFPTYLKILMKFGLNSKTCKIVFVIILIETSVNFKTYYIRYFQKKIKYTFLLCYYVSRRKKLFFYQWQQLYYNPSK